jgi:acyl-CoA thioester hydrolase
MEVAMQGQVFSLEIAVRDYECDLQGVVNNAVYQHYLEHARHEFLKAAGIDFAEYTRAGIHLVVIRAELDYRHSLTSGDLCRVDTRMTRISRIKFGFIQQIVDLHRDKVALDAIITGVALDQRGRPYLPSALDQLLTAQEHV